MKASFSDCKWYMPAALRMIIILVAASLLIITPTLVMDRRLALVAVRIDDVQDFYCRDAQLALFEYSLNNSVPLTLGIIPGLFGLDKELVDAVKSVMNSGSEAGVHGWEHEDFARFSLEEQKMRLQQGKACLNEILGITASIFVPPMFSYNDDTLVAMHANGLSIISGLSQMQQQGELGGEILSIPATIELSDLVNGTWKMKSAESVMTEVIASIHLHGYAMIVTHPQEFTKSGELDWDAISNYGTLIQSIAASYSFTTLDDLRDKI